MEGQYQQMISQNDDVHDVEPQPIDEVAQTSSAKEQPESDQADEEGPLLIALEDELYVIDCEFDRLE